MNTSLPPIAILGAGAWGTALATHLAHNGQKVLLWGHDAEHIDSLQQSLVNAADGVQLYTDLAASLETAQDILVAVPSCAFKTLTKQLAPIIRPQHRIVWASKGLMPQTHELPRKYVQQTLGPTRPHAILSGPSFANEVAAGIPTLISLACQQEDFTHDLQQRLENRTFRLVLSDDLIGVQLCGVVKNVMAIAAGILDALGYGVNTQSDLITCGLAEITQLGLAMGAHRETFTSPAGIGDLVLTCTDNQSRNRRFGLYLGQGKSLAEVRKLINQTTEGYDSTLGIHHLTQRYHITMPLCRCVYKIIRQQQASESIIDTLMSHSV